jgi:hypothetical protein
MNACQKSNEKKINEEEKQRRSYQMEKQLAHSTLTAKEYDNRKFVTHSTLVYE